MRYVVYLEDVGLHLNLCASLLTEPSEHDGCLVGKWTKNSFKVPFVVYNAPGNLLWVNGEAGLQFNKTGINRWLLVMSEDYVVESMVPFSPYSYWIWRCTMLHLKFAGCLPLDIERILWFNEWNYLPFSGLWPKTKDSAFYRELWFCFLYSADVKFCPLH
jgi:hypothetical protein